MARRKELFVLQVISGRMIHRESAGDAGELFTSKSSEQSAEVAALNDSRKLFDVLSNLAADESEIFGHGHV